jgi:uncharacterized protein (TIGR00106 family)
VKRRKDVLLEFSMFPLDKGESVGKYVARSLDVIDKSGLDYRLHAMGTVLEGGWDETFRVVRKCFERMRKDCRRVVVTIKVDHRRGASGRLASKPAAVEKRLGRSLKGVGSGR